MLHTAVPLQLQLLLLPVQAVFPLQLLHTVPPLQVQEEELFVQATFELQFWHSPVLHEQVVFTLHQVVL